MSETHTVRGDVSAYGLAIGLVQETIRHTTEGREYRITLRSNGCTYDVNAGYTDEIPGWIIGNNRVKLLAGWAQFDRLGDARQFFRWASATAQTPADITLRAARIMGAFADATPKAVA